MMHQRGRGCLHHVWPHAAMCSLSLASLERLIGA
jgi:hypothetical protein